MFSPVRALLRRYAIAHFLVVLMVFLPLLAFAPHRPFSSWSWWWLAMQIPFALLILDTAVVFYYARQINRVLPMRGFKEALLYGATWKGLRTMAGEAQGFTRRFAEIERAFPELRDDRAYAAAMSQRDFLTAQQVFERIERKRGQEAKVAERRARKDVSRQVEIAGLASAATMLGAAEDEIEAAKESGIPALQGLVASYRRRQMLLEAAEKAACRSYIERILDAGSVAAAEAALGEVQRLWLRAKQCNAEDQLRAVLSSGQPERAEKVVSDAEQNHLCFKTQEGLRKGITTKVMPEADRSALLERVERLGSLAYNSRAFRMEVYAIEQSLES